MSFISKPAAVLAATIASFGSLGVAIVATATPSAALTCSDNWVGPTTGTQSWNTAANWSAGLPNGSSVACIQAAGTYTVQNNGANAPAAVQVGGAASGIQTLEIDGAGFSNTQADLVESGGVLSLVPSSTADAYVADNAGLTIQSGGSLTTTGTSHNATISAPLVNQGSVTLGATSNTTGSVTISNEGSFAVSSGATFTYSGSNFTDSSGTLAVNGSFDAENTFTQSGATESGNPVNVTGTLDDSAGTGAFTATNGGGIQGTIPVGQTVTVLGSNEVAGTSSTGLTVDGNLVLDPTSTSDADISANSTWPGLTVAAGGVLSSNGTSHQAGLGANILNQGTVTLGATTNIGTGAITNEGTFTVSSGASFNTAGDFTDASGSLNVNGSFTEQNVFTQSGATETGNAAILGGNLIDSAGTGSFLYVRLGGTIEGTIPAGQTVTVGNGGFGNNNTVIGTSSAGVTVDGTLVVAPGSGTSHAAIVSAGNPTWPGIIVGSGGTLLTTGGSNLPQDYAEIATNVTVDAGGTATISATNTIFDAGGTTWNSTGTVQISATGHLQINGSAGLTSSGTFGVTVGSGVSPGLGSLSDSAGFPGSLTLTGTLAVGTVGSEGGGTVVTDPNGVGGGFSNFSFGPDYYTVTSTSTTVSVAAGTPFSASPTAFSAAENEPVTTPQVASYTTNGEPGTYSATVNYGDGTGTLPATVHPSGGGGTVSGPTHTFTAPGTYTVTTTISTTAGTTIPVSESVTVTGPTISGLSKTTVAPGKSLSTIVSGTNFDGTGAPSGFSTSDPAHLTVVSVIYKAATKKKPSEYKVHLKASKTAPVESVSLTLTQTGSEPGIVTDTGAVNIT